MIRLLCVALSVVLSVQSARDRVVPPEAVGTGVVTGRVTIEVGDATTPVRRATVTLESSALERPREVDSDTDGRYRFDRLPAGTYRVGAEKAGFVPHVRDPRRAFSPAPQFDVGAGQTATRDLPMVRGAALEGRITTVAGVPVVNAVVSAVRVTYDASGRRPMPVRQTRTDDLGRFRVHTLSAGQYYLEAAIDPLQALQRAAMPGQPQTTLERTYYPGAPQIEGGRTIGLAIGQNVSDLEMTMPAITTAAIRGRVIDSTGGVPKAMSIRIQRVGGPVGELRGTFNPNGNDFTYPKVPPGSYWLMGVSRASASAPLEFGATPLTVLGQDLIDLVISTAPGAQVRGRVLIDGGTLPAQTTLRVVPHATAFELPAPFGETGEAMPSAVVDSAAAFNFTSLFGPTLLRVEGLPAGWALARVTIDGEDVTDRPVDFRANPAPRRADLVVTARTTTVTGQVRDGDGQAVPRARVVVFSEDDRLWGWRSRFVRSVEADENGQYSVVGLLPARYRVVAMSFLEEGSWMDATILGRLLPLADPLVSQEAAVLTRDLVVKPW